METLIRTTGATIIFFPPRRGTRRRIDAAVLEMAPSPMARLYAGFGTGSISVALTLAGCILSIALYLCFGVAIEGWGAPF